MWQCPVIVFYEEYQQRERLISRPCYKIEVSSMKNLRVKRNYWNFDMRLGIRFFVCFLFLFHDTIVVFVLHSFFSLIGFQPSYFGLIITFFCYFEDLVDIPSIDYFTVLEFDLNSKGLWSFGFLIWQVQHVNTTLFVNSFWYCFINLKIMRIAWYIFKTTIMNSS